MIVGKFRKRGIVIVLMSLLLACDDNILPWNSPYPKSEKEANIYYASFSEAPKTLDPARSYSSNEAIFTGQIYEPPLQYHYLKRPYTLIPLTAASMPTVHYFDATGKQLVSAQTGVPVAYSVYEIRIKPGIYYQPHVAFGKTKTRELIAEDYVYQIKRLADPKLQSPIFGLMSKYIKGLSEYAENLQQARTKLNSPLSFFLDLRQFSLTGATVIDRYTYQIIIKGNYPQLLYWLAMPFFAPLPWEVDRFYSQPDLMEKNMTLDWYPVGTGAYYLTLNNPQSKMVLTRNPNYHGDVFPTEGAVGDREKGLLIDAGKKLPFIEQFVFSLEKESIPHWNKFLQGYYDSSEVNANSFDQVIKIDQNDQPQLMPAMQEKGIRLNISTSPGIYYLGFNMQDPVVGGQSERARKLRQAIAIAIDEEEFIAIFLNGRGIPAQSPLPPDIFGYSPQSNPFIYDGVKRKPIEFAQQLLIKAGYPDGKDPKTHAPLILHYDTAGGTGPDDHAHFNWMRKQFAKLGIQLEIRATQYNRFQEKMRAGDAQIFSWGWNADYPDPENFLFLLYGPNGKAKYGGENASNYNNPAYDRLFERMKNLPNDASRQKIITAMVNIVQRDTPWVWGFHPKSFQLSHAWLRVTKPNAMANNGLKYLRIDPKLRAQLRQQWNQPILWPLGVLAVLVLLSVGSMIIYHWRKTHTA